MAPIQKDATGTQVRDPVMVCAGMVCAQVVLVLTVVTIVLLNVCIVVVRGCHMKEVKGRKTEEKTAVENVGGVHNQYGTWLIGVLPNVGLACKSHHNPSSNTGMIQ